MQSDSERKTTYAIYLKKAVRDSLSDVEAIKVRAQRVLRDCGANPADFRFASVVLGRFSAQLTDRSAAACRRHVDVDSVTLVATANPNDRSR